MRYALLLMFACAGTTSAQDSVHGDPPDRSSRPSGPIAIVTGGPSMNGPAMRLLVVSERRLSDQMSIGLASRLVGARGAYPIAETLVTDEELYVEFGLSLRPAVHLTHHVQVAASAGYGIVLLTDGDASYLPVNDIGFTLPLELEGAVRVWETIGLTAAVSRSVALSSWRTESESHRFPDDHALDHWTATVGVRLGRW